MSLSHAIAGGRSELTEMLLAAGADVNGEYFRTHKSPLMAAIHRKDAGLSQMLLAAGAAVYMVHFNSSALPEAVSWGCYPLIQDMINVCGDINAPGPSGGETALTVAVTRGEKVIIQLLIDSGADVNGSPLNPARKSPLEAAVQK